MGNARSAGTKSAENDDTEQQSIMFTKMVEKQVAPPSILTELTDNSSESSSEIGEDTFSRGYTHPLFESEHDPHEPKTIDPYADVRDQMEKLARADREKHFLDDKKNKPLSVVDINIPFFTALTTYFAYAVLILCGYINDFFAGVFSTGRYQHSVHFPSDDVAKYARLLTDKETFYVRRIYNRVQDVFNRPIASNPGAYIQILERMSDDGQKTMKLIGGGVTDSKDRITRKCINLGSYNYFGFGDDWNSTCASEVLPAIANLPISSTSSSVEAGYTICHQELECLIAKFLGKETAFVHNMGFNTNATTIPALVGKGDLLISDELNHTSIVQGARSSGANIRVFRHNDVQHLEEILSEAILMGRPRTRRPFKKIMVVVEGIYSMEGEYCNLGPINKVCKKYGAYLYLDEAHSIGAMGPTGRGCSEYWGVDDVDIMMGTFSKSFGGMGGYIAGEKKVIDSLRLSCTGSLYHNTMSPIVCQQIVTSLKILMGIDGTSIGKKKITDLRDNSNYFRMRLTEMNLHVLGNYDSPVMPIMLYTPTKVSGFSRECLKRGVAVVVVGFPAVPLIMSRARFCISSSHTRQDLDKALVQIEEVVDILKLRYKTSYLA